MDYFYFSLFTNTLTQIFLKSHSVHADRMAFLIKIDSSREYLDPAGREKPSHTLILLTENQPI